MTGLVSACRNWLDEYAEKYFSGDAGRDYNLRLKLDHCVRVRSEARMILDSLDLPPRLDELIDAAALLHDAGRFEQYRRFTTFDDRRSVSHGRLGVDVLRQEAVLSGLSRVDRAVILGAVFLHGRKNFPASCARDVALATRVVRDADKLDIYPIMLAHFDPDKPRNEVVVLHLRDEPESFTPALFGDIRAGRLVSYSDMVYVNDFKILLLSWVFDLNFAVTRRAVLRRDYIGRIMRMLPSDPEVERAGEMVRRALAE